VTASWVPYALYYIRRIRSKAMERAGAVSSVAGSLDYDVGADVLAKNHIYVACFVDEDLPYIMEQTGEDNLLIGSDFVHHDHATELDYISALKARGDLTPTQVRKITEDNPRAFYAL
ncbi:MAG TPA: hypothetical protein VFS62_16160, partial [Chloroflexota bacterium]|nr:hypothetical protein [Chloroflexota bacterium]